MQLETRKLLYVLIHGYDAVSDEVVWDIVETKLPVLRAEFEAILGDA